MKKLLLIGKAPGFAKRLRASAKRSGFSFVQVDTSAQARQRLQQIGSFEAVVMLVSPIVSQFMLIEEIRGRFKKIPIFAAFNSSDSSDRALAHAYGATGILDRALKYSHEAFKRILPSF